MSELRTKINEDIKNAMKSRETVKLEALRMLNSAIKNREIEMRPNPISDEEIGAVVKKLIKQRKESIEQFQAANRQDLVDKESFELSVIEVYLPAQMDRAQIEAVVSKVVTDLGASSVKDMGRVMKEVLARTGGSADGKIVSELVKSKLQ